MSDDDDQSPQKVIIMGAAGRDFHNFNVYFRNNKQYNIIAFTATQIPDIDDKLYPPELSGPLYPNGIPIQSEDDLADLIQTHDIDQVILAYSDLPHSYVMEKAALVMTNGADFRLMGPNSTMIKSNKALISICAVRTGCGKSAVTRRVADILQMKGKKVIAIRHPMPYGDLRKQIWQRYETYDDLDKYECTIEEREEYEPHIDKGVIIYAGVDYQEILNRVEAEDPDVILWDGGNNDLPFYKPDLHIVLVDPHRPGHELSYYPGATNLRMADVVIINKMETAKPENIEIVRNNIAKVNPNARVIQGALPISIDDPELIKDKRVLVVDDGPTLTHGEMPYGAGALAAQQFGASELVNPKSCAVGSIQDTFEKFPHLENVLPAMGYSDEQVKELQDTINACDCDLVVSGTPIDIQRVINVNKPIIRIKYSFQEQQEGVLEEILDEF
jgi:predicted GTPase